MNRYFAVIAGVSLLCATNAFSLSVAELQNDAKLTPTRFARYFSDFDFKYHPEVQPADVFLGSRSGDCDDYAILADSLLSAKGYHTRLVYVAMPDGPAHVVCYVAEEKGYLDYNNRSFLFKIERSGSSLEDIATKVAKSFKTKWSIASEFNYAAGKKHVLTTVFKMGSPMNGGLQAARAPMKVATAATH